LWIRKKEKRENDDIGELLLKNGNDATFDSLTSDRKQKKKTWRRESSIE